MGLFHKTATFSSTITTRVTAAGIALALAAGCTTAPTQRVDLWDQENAPKSANQKWAQLDDLTRLELADIANSVYVAAPRIALANGGPSSYFSTVSDHERAFEERSNDKVRKTRNLRFNSYDADKFESINNEVPPGFVLTQIGYQHQNSGMICPFGMATEDESFGLEITQIRLFDNASTDVGCDYKTNGGGLITIFASHWPEITQEQHAAAADKQIRDQFTTELALEVPMVTLDDYNPAIMGTATASGYDISEENSLQKIKSSVWVVKTRDWHVKARATHFMSDALTELFAAIMHNRTHVDVFNHAGSILGEIDV